MIPAMGGLWGNCEEFPSRFGKGSGQDRSCRCKKIMKICHAKGKYVLAVGRYHLCLRFLGFGFQLIGLDFVSSNFVSVI